MPQRLSFTPNSTCYHYETTKGIQWVDTDGTELGLSDSTLISHQKLEQPWEKKERLSISGIVILISPKMRSYNA